ncbi:Lrp/AsnC family transcriptional regulator [Methylobacterium organophilum]|uniref:Lrp/AsnC family transcriptional regulator n=1 Tax=Methylobacterium organophilum TaxID=410 RepID=UPI001F138103|nr:Lrp/AsnC family transcriptional regulator [Methylobacterium organophilum]UMY19868.1 Lrp/AsnC family transcriptional regulator [Methylobacterium organophilum]
MVHLDAIDQEIVRILRDDGRISNADLAAKIGLSPSSCLRRVRALEQSGVIRGYAALIDMGSDRPELVVLTQISLERQTEDFLNRFEAAIRRCPEVQDCYLMTGSADYLVKLHVKGAPDYERVHKEVLSRIPGVARLQSSFAIRTVVTPQGR